MKNIYPVKSKSVNLKNALKPELKRIFLISVLVLALSSLPRILLADTHTAVANGTWSTALIWDLGSAPSSGDDVVIPTGLTISGVPTITINNLEMTEASLSGSTLTLTGSILIHSGGSSISCPLQLSGARTFNIDADGSLTISGAISTGAIVKSGSGILTLSGINTFTGGVTLSVGKLNINNSSALGKGRFTIANSTTIDNTSGNDITIANNAQTWRGSFTFEGTNNLNMGTGAITVTADADYQITTNKNTLTVGGAINSNTTSIIKSGSGTLSFGTRSVAIKDITINQGTLVSTSNTMSIYGDFTNNSVFENNNGVVSFVGYNQTISGTSSTNFKNLQINSDATTTIPSNYCVTVTGDLSTYDNLIIQSTTVNDNGSLIVYGTGSGLVNYNRCFRLKSSRGDRHFFSSPVGDQDISDFITNNDGKIITIWGYSEPDSYPNNWPELTSGTFASGLGYNLSQTTTSNGIFSFTGPIVNSVTITATSPYSTPVSTGDTAEYNSRWKKDPYRSNYGCGGWNLLGNPFTSAMNAVSFISENTNSFDPNYKAIYVYDGTQDKYYYIASSAPFSTLGGPFSYSNIQVGQGFWVLANYNGVQFSFTPDMQTHDTQVTMTKSAESDGSWAGMLLKASCGNYNDQTTILYNDNMTAGLDPGYDIGQFTSSPGISLYTSLVKDNGINFARQALPMPQAGDNVVAIGVDSENGGNVTFSATTIPIDGFKYVLEDRTTNTFTDLSTGNYTVTLPAKTYGTGRFFLHVKDGPITGINDPSSDPDLQDIRIWGSGKTILIKGELNPNSKAEIFDLQGRKVYDAILPDGSFNSITLSSPSGSVYIVKVTDGKKVVTGKVVLL